MLALVIVGCKGETEDTDAPQCVDIPIDVPSGRGEIDGVFDTDNNRLVFFGGNEAVPVNCSPGSTSFVGETWAYERDCDNFRLLDPAGRARRRSRPVSR